MSHWFNYQASLKILIFGLLLRGFRPVALETHQSQYGKFAIYCQVEFGRRLANSPAGSSESLRFASSTLEAAPVNRFVVCQSKPTLWYANPSVERSRSDAP